MEIIKINPKKPEKSKLLLVAGLVKRGKVVIFPTDTVYIPITDVTNQKAVKKVFLIKKRLLSKPLPIFVKDIQMAKKIAKIDRRQESFLKSVWPGRVTAVLKRKRTRIKLYGVAKDTIAIRIPNFKPVNFLLTKLNRPLVGTSANIAGQLASGDIQEVLGQFRCKKYQPDVILDAGRLPRRRPSKVIDLTSYPFKILRS